MADFSLVTARATLFHVASLVEGAFTPPGRAVAIAATLRQIGALAGDVCVSPGDVRVAMLIVAAERGDDSPAVAARRRTCGEIAEAIDHEPMARPSRYGDVLRAVATALTDSTDPRQIAVAATATREADEISGDLAARAAAPRGAMRGESTMEALARAVDDDRRGDQ